MNILISSMAYTGQEPLGSMGNDTALSIFSDTPKLLYSYFKQLFAQVTNPPIDPIREDIVMSLTTQIGTKANILIDTKENGNTYVLKSPIIDNKTLDYIKNINLNGHKTEILDITFKVSESLEEKLEKIFIEAENNII